ncbi:MAG: ATP-dependent Clp protease proteolytic subunit [Planctomycetota bacterium]
MDASTFTPPAGFSSQPSAGEPRTAGDLSVPSRELEGAARAEYYIPVVVERTGRGERSWDIYSRLLEDRIIFIGSPIGDGLANAVIAQLLYLQKADKARDIHVYVNSPGGSVSAGLAIYDTMQYVSCPVETVCVGMAASMAAILLSAGSPGKRFALPHARIMMHQPWGGVQGTAADVAIEAEEILEMKNQLTKIVARHTGRTIEQVDRETDRNKYMSAAQAREWGVIDEVVESLKPKVAPKPGDADRPSILR